MPETQPLSILVVDDSPEDRFISRMYLSDSSLAGCVIHEAANGAECLDMARRVRPDCILLDQGLPDMDGGRVLDALRDSAGEAEFAVVMLTGSNDEAAALAALKAGAQGYLSKELIDPRTLALTIRGAIDRFRLVRGRRAEEAKLRLFIERTPVAVAMLDREARYVLASGRYAREAVGQGRKPADLTGLSLREAIPELPDSWYVAFGRVLAGETLSAKENCFVRSDGQTEWWRWEMTPWTEVDGTVGGVLVFAELLNVRKEAEQALRESEERLRISQEVAGIGTWDWNVQSGRIHWSPQQYRLFGFEPGEKGLPEYDTWRLAIHPDDRDAANALVMDALAGKTTYDTAFRILLPPSRGGGVRWLYARGEVFRDADGLPLRMLGVNMDITERHNTEQALRRLTENLERRVTEEIAAREEGQVLLMRAQKMEALGQLAGGIAHDFNNVLQSASAGLSMIQRRAGDPEAVRRFARMAQEAVERGANVTGRLLTFSRSGAPRTDPVSPLSLLRALREMLFNTLGPSIGLIVEGEAELPTLVADKGQLETVLVNLAVNARDAMPEGGTLTLRAGSEQVDPEASHPAGLDPGLYVSLSIIDTGTGMDAATLARAGELFFTTKPVGKGTGLGLSMARGFAERSGGGFRIHSVPGEGTVVTLWFPTSAAVAPDRRFPACPEPPPDSAG